MPKRVFHGVGAVISADIAVPDHEREVHFYSRVLSTGEQPLWREDDLMNNLGMPIIGLGARTAEYAHLPLQWMPHVQVADVATSVQHALDLGGSILMHAQDEDGESQWAVLLDPDGAALGIIPVVPAEAVPSAPDAGSSSAAESAGRIHWLDLTVPHASATLNFYQRVVGWAVRDVAVEDGDHRYVDYELLRDDGDPVAGIRHAHGVNAGLPPVWMIHLPVGDLAESLRRVGEEGGKIIRATRGSDREYVYAAVQDPVGACVALLPG
jgi:uncharacterized protein